MYLETYTKNPEKIQVPSVYIYIYIYIYPVRCAHNPPPCRIVQGPWTMVHGPWTDNDDNDDAKNDNNSNWQKLPFP